MSTPDSPYPPGQQGPGGQGGYQPGGYQPPRHQQNGQQPRGGQQGGYQPPQYDQTQYQQPQYQQGQYQQGQYQQGQYGYGQDPQAGPYQQGGPYQQAGPYQQGAPYGQAGPYQQAGPYGPMPQGQYMQPGYGVPFGPGSYLGGGGVGFGDAIKLAFQNAFMYQGRASRSAYWWWALFSFVVSIGVDVVLGGIAGNSGAAGAGITVISALASLTMFIVGLPLIIRRLHDIDRSGWWLLIGLIPIVGAITLLVFALLDGTPGPNRFG